MAISTNGTVLTRLAGALYNTQMSNATYKEVAALDPTALANVLYARDFNTVSDATVAATLVTNLGLSSVAGLTNWVAAQLTAAGSAKGAKVVELLNGFAQMASDATYGAAATAFNIKVDAALALSQTTDNTGGTFDSISTAISGKTFTLTSSVETVTGGAGSDQFSALVNIASTTTLNAGDVVKAGAGNDTLTVSVDAGSGLTIAGVTSADLEKIGVINTSATGTATYNLLNATGVTTLSAENSIGNVAFSNAAAGVGASMGGGAANLSVTSKSLVFSGATDSFSLAVSGLTGNTTGTTGAFTVTDAAAGIVETLNISSTGGATNTLAIDASNDHKTLVITGDTGITLTNALDTTTKTVNASALTGALTVTLANIDETITGGSGNDTVIQGSTTINSADSIDAGAGRDTFRSNVSLTSTDTKYVTGFEVLAGDVSVAATATTSGTATSLTLSKAAFSSVDEVNVYRVTGDADAAVGTGTTSVTTNLYGAVSVTGLAGTETLSIRSGAIVNSGDAVAATTYSATSILNASITAALATDTTSDSILVNLGSASGSTSGIEANAGGTITQGTTGVASVDSAITLTLSDNETITLNTRSGSSKIDSLVSTDLTTLNITGTKDLEIAAMTASNTKTINATDFTGSLTFGAATSTISGTYAYTLTGGAGNDAVYTGTKSDNLSGGAGNDTITGGGGNDTVSGGDGNDALTGGSGNDSLSGDAGDDTLTGSTGNDVINGGAGNDIIVSDVTVATGAIDFDTYDAFDGGDGVDTIRFNGTQTAATTLDFSGSTLTSFSGVKNMERIQLNMAGAYTQTLKVGDVLLGAFNNDLTVTVGTSASATGAAAVDASGTLNSASKVTFTGQTAVANTYTLGNNIDNVTFSTGGDTAVVTNTLFLQGTDSVRGGSGADTLKFDTGATLVISAAALAGVSSFETFNVDFSTGTTSSATITLSDAVAVANADQGTNTLTIQRDTSETGTLKVTGSDVATVKLSIVGGAGSDTLTGGAGNDTITGNGGADNLSGGAGNDTFIIDGANEGAAGEVITGGDGTDTVQFAASATAVGVTLSGVEIIDFDRTATTTSAYTATLDQGVLNGQAITITADALATGSTATPSLIAVDVSAISSFSLSSLTVSDTDIDSGANEFYFKVSSSATAGQVIVGSGVDDSISGGSGNDTINGGQGDDTVSGGNGVDVVYFNGESTTATAGYVDTYLVNGVDDGTGNYTATSMYLSTATSGIIGATSTASTGIDFRSSASAIIYAQAGDKISVATGGTAGTGLAWGATTSTAVATAGAVAADGAVKTVKGVYTESDGTFAYSATGTDLLISYDTGEATTAAVLADVIIVVGSASISTISSGVITLG